MNLPERIKKILEVKEISAAQLADEIGVQRSGLSHILSGRNKPSLDFIQKILTRYNDINPDWLILGSGGISQQEKTVKTQNAITKKKAKTEGRDSEIDRIVVFYANGTFKEYQPA